MSERVRYFLRFRSEVELGGFHAFDGLCSHIFHVEGFQHVVSAAAKTEHQETFKCLAILAGVVNRYLVDFRLIDLNFAVVEQHVFLLRIGDVCRHLNIVARTPEIYLALLCVSFIHNLRILIPHEAGFSGAEVCGGLIHLCQHAFQRAV